MPAEQHLRSAIVDPNHHQHHNRRQRNATRSSVVGGGTLARRTSATVADNHQTVQDSLPAENADLSAMRVKKKIKHKRTWDEPEAQASEMRNATSKRPPDRIKTRRRLVPASSTARALRTTATAMHARQQDDPYYDFGKKIKQTSSSTAVVGGLGNGLAIDPAELMRTLAAAGSPATTTMTAAATTTSDDAFLAVRARIPSNHRVAAASPPPPPQYPNGATTTSRRPDECVYPRFVGRRNKSRTQRDANRCMPSTASASTAAAVESDARTTRILSTVVTSVSSVVKGNQKKNDTVAAAAAAAADEADDDDDDVNYRPTSSSSSTVPSPEQSSVYPKYVRSRYRNISLPEYLEITRVNQRRLNNNNNNNVTIVATEVTTVRPNTEAVRPITTLSAVRGMTSSSSLSSFSEMTSSSSSAEVTARSTEVSSLSSSPADSIDETTDAADRSLPLDGDPSPSSTSPPPPNDLQDFIYLNNGSTTASPAHTAAIGARQDRRPLPPFRNVTARSSTEHDVGVVYPDGLATSTYLLTFLAIVPLVLVIAFAFKLAVRRKRKKKKKKVFDSSEYSSEYNRSPLDFNTITSSPITTKLPRVPQHIVWDADKTAAVASGAVPPPLPSNCSRWEFPRDKLRLQTILGQGNFGQVWKAEADDISGHEGLTRLVAVKMVKEDAASREREDLIRELDIMQHLGSHPNVVTLLGCCTEKGVYA